MKTNNDRVQKAAAKHNYKNESHNIKLVIGDWSEDGHGKKVVLQIKCNLSLKELQAAYKKGSKKVGFNFIETVASNYEDGCLPAKKWKKLENLGCKIELEFYNDEDDSEGFNLYSESYAELVLFICSLSEPTLKYKFVETDYSNQWTIGGYGLFE